MTPRGSLAYLAGLGMLCLGLGLVGLLILFALLEQPRPHPAGMVVVLLILSGILVFAAAHLLAGGLFRMLVHLHRAISRTDPAGDRPLKGTRVYLLGQIS